MSNVNVRIRDAVDELTGNEALLEMLETDAAEELLQWGITMVTALVKQAEGLDDAAVESTMMPRFKAVRQSMRAIGNWAAGKYADPESRIQLREKLLQYFEMIRGTNATPPVAEELDAVLNEVDEKYKTPLQLILKLKTLFPESM